MTNIIDRIRKSLSDKLSLSIIVLAVPTFVIALGVLFTQSRHIIRKEAIGRVNSVLSMTMQRVNRNMLAIETGTNANYWQVAHHLRPDSLLALSHRIVKQNPHIDGCSISMEPDEFSEYGRYFSVYSVRENMGYRAVDNQMEEDSVSTVIEEQYEYFDKVWYQMPKEIGGPCWAVYFDEEDSLELTIDGMLASYGRPIYDDNGDFVGVISSDLSLLRLSKVINRERPYPHSYFMMINEEGYYYVHPDSARLFTHTIFDDTDPMKQVDLIALGHEMTAGKQGSMAVDMDGEPCLVCYQPVPGTNWSLAIVCPDSDVLAGYHQQTYIVILLLVIGLTIILMLCHRAVAQAIRPLHQLLKKTQSIAEGNMEVHIPRSDRIDAVGRLQNSFATMLQSLNFHMGSVRYASEQMQHRNEELVVATRLAEDSDRQKAAFIQNVTHQIRTPLNIIMGFAQVLREPVCDLTQQSSMSDDELKSIANTMDHNAKLLFRLVTMLFDSSDTGFTEELNSPQMDMVPCNDVAREVISYLKEHYPEVNVTFLSEVGDDFCFQTNHLYLMRCLRELLYNAAKYSDGKNVSLSVSLHKENIRFVVQDTGKGIPESDHELIFKFFTKIDDLSEGLGLGLPLAKRHAVNLGGDLTLDESYHDGCRFIVEIPLEQHSDY